MKPRHAIALTALATVGWGSCEMSGVAHAAGNCGGQNAAPQPVPYTCTLPGIDITVSGVTRHFSAVVVANGTNVVVTYTMSAPLPVAVPIRIVHHQGISGAGGTENESQGVIPAGATTATLTDSAPCREGQLDVKAVNTSNGSGDKFRVGGPWIQNGSGCIDTTTIPQSSTTIPSSSSSTVPPSTSVTTPAPPGSPSTAPTTSKVGGGALPATGSSAGPVWVGLGLLVVGLLALTVAVRRRSV